VVAAVRDPSHSTSKALQDLPKASGSSLIIVKIDSLSESDAGNAVAELSSKHNITALDVVIANAGIAKVYPRVDEAKVSDILEHYQVNVVGTILLFQAVLPLLKKSSTTPKFIVIGSSAGTIGDMDSIPFPNAAYGPSKAALSWVAKKMARENADMVIFPVHPG
jgi:norsolorinic acid ketoreductase